MNRPKHHRRLGAGVTKLQDANDAGTRLSEGCTLILTEGDSAKALVIDGLSVAGRDSFGVFPLRCADPCNDTASACMCLAGD